ncbi:MAG TPA: GNAT family N-acetyltransferase [Phycisphaerales bacterium]|nr:GNAT family N-acetyltransferase [Phycisphaerales bacterium]
MPPTDSLTAPTSQPDIDAVVRATSLAFAGPPDATDAWLRAAGLDNVRVLHESGAPAASLVRIPMGQHFGGRSVPMLGIAAVAVPPERRGGGLARRLMAAAVREAHADGFSLSTLYASTQAFYRQVGYEQAGLLFRTTLPLRTIGVRDRTLPVRPLDGSDERAIRDCYARFTARYSGTLDRGPYCWQRTREMRGERYAGFGVPSPDRPGALDAYVYYAQRRKPDSGRHDAAISDLAFTNARAGRRLLGFLADLATVGDDAVFYGPPLHPLLTLMDQQFHTSTFVDVWMLRIVRVREALESRGYPAHADAILTLDVADDLIPDNAGPWTIRVRDGCASVERSPGPRTLRLTIRGLGAIYSGLYSATQAAALGLAEGDAETLAAADAIFASNTPWMSDRF